MENLSRNRKFSGLFANPFHTLKNAAAAAPPALQLDQAE
jgi:hypothetical protein